MRFAAWYAPRQVQPVAPFSPEELQEVCDLDMAQKQHILALYHLLGNVTYYSLLGVDPFAEKKTIKASYYNLASTVHPDKFFRKNLGSFRKRMEDVFARLTEAMEILTNPERRKEYDDYLRMHGLIASRPPPSPEARGSASSKPAARSGSQPVARMASQPSMRAAAPSPSNTPSTPSMRAAAPSPSNIRSPSIPAMRSVSISETVLPTQEELAARKQALARKLLGKRPPSQSQPAAHEVAPPPDNTAGNAVATLRARYEQGLKNAKEKGSHKYLEEANTLCERKDFVGAKSAIEHGIRAFPDNEVLKRRLVEVDELAAPQLFAKYVSQAEEEQTSRPEEAGRFWLRAAELRKNDHDTNHKAANSLFRHNGNMKDAAECAKRAVHQQPKNAKYRVLLANIYLAAGLKASAKKEADEARAIAPRDADVVALLKRV